MNRQFDLARWVKSVCNKDYSCSVRIQKKIAFTLAETLIVMGIIGVVAALTLPNLNSSTGEKEKVVKVKKVYQNLSDAVGRAQAVYGPYSEWFANDSTTTAQVTRFANRVSEFLKVSKDCGTSGSGCISSTYNTKQNSYKREHTENIMGSNFYTMVLADGTSISFDKRNNRIFFDIDGINKGTSISGKDIFSLNVDLGTGVVTPTGAADNSSVMLTCSCFDNGYTDCTAWVVMHDNMDYLKTDSSGTCVIGSPLSSDSIKLDGINNTTCK